MPAQFFDMPALTVPTPLTVVQETSGAGAAVSITLTAVGGYRHYLPALYWSYSAAPSGGKLTITGLNGEDFEIDITASGPGPLALPPMVGATSTSVVVTLAAGGGVILGKLNVLYATLPAVFTYQGTQIAKSVPRNLMP